jgi:hypothetical protein
MLDLFSVSMSEKLPIELKETVLSSVPQRSPESRTRDLASTDEAA